MSCSICEYVRVGACVRKCVCVYGREREREREGVRDGERGGERGGEKPMISFVTATCRFHFLRKWVIIKIRNQILFYIHYC